GAYEFADAALTRTVRPDLLLVKLRKARQLRPGIRRYLGTGAASRPPLQGPAPPCQMRMLCSPHQHRARHREIIMVSHRTLINHPVLPEFNLQAHELLISVDTVGAI